MSTACLYRLARCRNTISGPATCQRSRSRPLPDPRRYVERYAQPDKIEFGMDEEAKVSRRVDALDLATGEWRELPTTLRDSGYVIAGSCSGFFLSARATAAPRRS